MTDRPPSSAKLIAAPNFNDVLLGRGAASNTFIGNKSYRRLVESRKEEYRACRKRRDKIEIAQDLYDQVHAVGGRFLREAKGLDAEAKPVYYEVSESIALEKCKQALREKKDHSQDKEEKGTDQDELGGQSMATQSLLLMAAGAGVPDGTPFSTPLIAASACSLPKNPACLAVEQNVSAVGSMPLASSPSSGAIGVHTGSPSGSSSSVGLALTQTSRLVPLLPSTLLGTGMGSGGSIENRLLLRGNPRWALQQQMKMQPQTIGPNGFRHLATRINPAAFNAGVQQGVPVNKSAEVACTLSDREICSTILHGSQALSTASATVYHRPGINASCQESFRGVSPRRSRHDGSQEATGLSSVPKSEEDSVKCRDKASVSSPCPAMDITSRGQETVPNEGASSAAVLEQDNTKDAVQVSDEDESEFFLSFLEGSNKPKFTEQHERLERASLTDAERSSALADMFGRMCTIKPNKRANCDLDEESIRFLIQQMRFEMDRIPNDKKLALLEAQLKCDAGEFSNARLERFLRCEGMNIELGARRFVNYWECRRELFGPEKYLLPMTLSGALRDDLVALETGTFRLLPSLDSSGRQLVVLEVHRHTREQYTSESMLRAMWYAMDVAAQNNTHINSGIVHLVWEKHSTIWDHDYSMHDRVIHFDRTCWPVKVICSHICSPPWFITQFVKPVLVYLPDRHFRSRLVIHEGEGDALLEDLASYGILKEMLPRDMGGTVEFCQSEWIANRRAAELQEI